MADQGIAGVFSYAGRTQTPFAQPLPIRVGGFGGVAGLVAYLRTENITHIIDATHSFAAQISGNAVEAAKLTGIPLLALERAAWQPSLGDQWQNVPDMTAAVAALPAEPARVFLAIGRQQLEAFAVSPQHHYLLRLVDPATDPLPLVHVTVIIARGPFTYEADLALLTTHRISHVVAKNAGGNGARAKLDAARTLRLPVILVDRPSVAERPQVHNVPDVVEWLSHTANLGV